MGNMMLNKIKWSILFLLQFTSKKPSCSWLISTISLTYRWFVSLSVARQFPQPTVCCEQQQHPPPSEQSNGPGSSDSPSLVFHSSSADVARGAAALPGENTDSSREGQLLLTAHRKWWCVLLTCQHPFPWVFKPHSHKSKCLDGFWALAWRKVLQGKKLTDSFRWLLSEALTPSVAACAI